MMVLKYFRSVSNWLGNQLFLEKLYNPLGFGILCALAVGIAYIVSVLGLKYSMALPILIIAIPLIGACLLDQSIGLVLILITAFGIGLASKYAELPFGILLDALLILLFIGMLLNQIRFRVSGYAKSPISVLIFIWVIYNIIQVLNPSAGSQLAWIFTVRSMAILILLYFVACYAFRTERIIMRTLKLIIGLTFISALYGLKQEYFGFTDAELVWLYSDPERIRLIHQWSRLRIFSFFSDPTNFGILLSYMCTFCLILMTGPFSNLRKIILGVAAVSMILAMAYAGSRTPFVLMPFGLVIFALMSMNRKVIAILGIFMVLGTGMVLKSTNSAVIYRIQSAFLLSKSDDTMRVRLENQKIIQPFIHRHPFGGGLGSTGIWGKRFTPDSLLSSFAHDSGFVRVAVELGWIGLTIYCLFLYLVLRTSIYYYFRVRNPKIKVIYLSLTVVFFQLTLANYPQEAMTILPTSIIFYILLAVLVKLKDFDDVVQPPSYPKLNQHADSKLDNVQGIPIRSRQNHPNLNNLKGGKRSSPLPKKLLDFFRHKS
ncbi:MAG: O-antigen ligase family protein [Bacteroidota bacterium]